MLPEDHIEAIKREGAAFAATLDAGDLSSTRVPTTPKWSLEELTLHLGRVHRWATEVVRTNATDQPQFPGRPDAVTKAWFEDGVAELVSTLEAADPDAPAWNFMGLKTGTRFWFRRQAQETVMHRCDAQIARGTLQPVETELALNGIDELLDHFLPLQAKLGNVDLGGSVHLHATDSPHGEWIARCEGGELAVGHGHEKGDVAVRGTASDLLLWLWGRKGIDALEVFGDDTIVKRWPEVLPSP